MATRGSVTHSTPKNIMTTPKHKQGDSSGSPSQTGSPSSSEELALTKIEKAKKGKYIRIKTWTDSSGSSMETHAKSITAAVKILRMSMRHHANWTLEFISEENA